MSGISLIHMVFFFFKQKTAYEMRISDWSSDVCSSDLVGRPIDRMLVISAVGKLRHRTARDIGDEQMEMLVVVEPIGKTARGTIPVTRDHDRIGFHLGLGQRRRRKEGDERAVRRSEEQTYELQSLMRISYDVSCLKNNKH